MRACWVAELPSAPAVAEGVTAGSNRAPYPHGALWKCSAWGRPVNVALNLEVGEAGAPSPLEISRAIVAAHACAGAVRFPVHGIGGNLKADVRHRLSHPAWKS